MLKRFSNFLRRMSKGWVVLTFLGLFILVVSVIFPIISTRLGVPDDVQKIDLLFGYTPQQLYRIMQEFGQVGRRAYALNHLTSDVIFPLVYAFLFSTAISYTFVRAFPPSSWLQYINLLPFGLLVVDFIENFSLVALLLTYPQKLTVLAGFAGAVTALKWVLSFLSVAASITGLAAMLFRKYKGGRLRPLNQGD